MAQKRTIQCDHPERNEEFPVLWQSLLVTVVLGQESRCFTLPQKTILKRVQAQIKELQNHTLRALRTLRETSVRINQKTIFLVHNHAR